MWWAWRNSPSWSMARTVAPRVSSTSTTVARPFLAAICRGLMVCNRKTCENNHIIDAYTPMQMWMLTFEVQCLWYWWELGRRSPPEWEEHTFHDSVELNVMINYNGNSSHPACCLIGHYEWWGNYSSTGDMKCWVPVDVQQREVCPGLMKQDICNQKSLSWSLRILNKDYTCTTSFKTDVIYSTILHDIKLFWQYKF